MDTMDMSVFTYVAGQLAFISSQTGFSNIQPKPGKKSVRYNNSERENSNKNRK